MGMILTIFPILVYIVFSSLNSLNDIIVKRMIFIITMCTSLYLNLVLSTSKEILLFSNIPIIICYFKREVKLSLLLSLIVILYSNYIYNVNVLILLINYLCYFVSYLFLYKKRRFISLFLIVSMIIQGISLSFHYFIFNKIINLFSYILVIYGFTFLILYLFKIADDISNLYVTYSKMIREKQLKDSLFKLTHEIKNPIAVCKGYLDMIDFNDREKTSKYVNVIKSEIDRSLNVISEFMDYNKIKINKDIMDIVMLMDEVYDSFKLLVSDKNIKFNYNNNYDEIYIMGDYDRLKQVFINIIKNSIESIYDTGVIDVYVDMIGTEVVISVNDSGIGMDMDELCNIKKMFFTTKRDGTGLGVALSNEIVLAHNGKLIYDSVKNEGTKCTVRLPI